MVGRWFISLQNGFLWGPILYTFDCPIFKCTPNIWQRDNTKDGPWTAYLLANMAIVKISHRIHVCYIIFIYIYHKNQLNVGKWTYAIHGSYGYGFLCSFYSSLIHALCFLFLHAAGVCWLRSTCARMARANSCFFRGITWCFLCLRKPTSKWKWEVFPEGLKFNIEIPLDYGKYLS